VDEMVSTVFCKFEECHTKKDYSIPVTIIAHQSSVTSSRGLVVEVELQDLVQHSIFCTSYTMFHAPFFRI